MEGPIEKKRLRVTKEMFKDILSSSATFPQLLFSTVRHPLERLVSAICPVGVINATIHLIIGEAKVK